MNLGKVLVPLGGLVVLFGAYRAYGWSGVALGAGAIVMFLLLHMNRAIAVLRRAADRPIGSVASAVMLNAKLKPRHTLMHVIAMTRALGEQRSPKDVQPEVYRWTDGSGSFVDVTFVNGRAQAWQLTRPPVQEEAIDAELAQPDATPGAEAVRPGTADALRPPV